MSADTDRTADAHGRERSSPPALAVEDVTKTFGDILAVDGASFEVPDGSVTGVIGPNGAGKTTMFNLISGIHTTSSGSIRVHGTEIQDWSPPEIAAIGVGRTFQIPRTFGGMTVRENLAFARRDQAGESILNNFVRPGTVADEEAAVQATIDEVLAFLDLEHLADDYGRELSGGQRKLLELGRLLMNDPDVLMLDEILAGVNPNLSDRLLERLEELNAEGLTIVMIEHDIDVIMNRCEKVVVMHMGQVLASGTPEEIQADERVLDAYLGGI